MRIKVYGILGLCLVFPMILGQRSEAGGLIQTSSECETVGRVMRSYDQGIKPNSPLCEGGEIRVGDRLKVHVSCFDRPANQWLSGGTYSIDRLCADRKDIRADCWLNPRCYRSGDRISLLSPQATSVTELSRIEWTPTQYADYYEIMISGLNVKYSSETTQSQLELPKELTFVPGEYYKLEVFAVGKTSIVARLVASIKKLTDQAAQEIADTISNIEKMNVSEHEKIQLIDAIYLSNGMPDLSAKFLETKPKSLLMVSLLADRYAEMGNAEKAKENYLLVSQLTSKDSEEFKFAQVMLGRIAALEPNSSFQ